jgi:molecular chaperone GrpE
MDENNINPQKPLRRTSNKIKDIYDAYVKNDKTKNIPINDAESDNDSDINVDNSNEEFTLDDAAFLEMQTRIEELTNSLNEANNKIESMQKENLENKELSLRKTAELENFRKRSIKEKSDLIEYANERLLSSLVEILDDLTAALSASTSANDTDSIKKGLELIYNKTKKLFDDAGVTPMVFNEDTQFDVHFHEALMMSPSDKPEGTVLQVLQNGYMLKDKILRHAKVITSSGIANN